jgi:hypothetical protein
MNYELIYTSQLLTTARNFFPNVLLNKLKFSCNKEASERSQFGRDTFLFKEEIYSRKKIICGNKLFVQIAC